MLKCNGRKPHNILPFDSLGPFTVDNDGFGKAFSVELSKTYEILIKTHDGDILFAWPGQDVYGNI
jgi:hypothetical protein